jgi:HPt (histidine-containing phosphotransfer) domain-containing protein
LAQRFVERCRDDLPKLRQILADAESCVGPGTEDLRLIVHRMAGSAALFGFAAIGAMAARIDEELATGMNAQRVSLSDTSYYNATRTHLGLEKDSSSRRSVERYGRIVACHILGGLHHQYCRM